MTRARKDLRAQRVELTSGQEAQPINRQGNLLDIPRSSFYHIPVPVSVDALMEAIEHNGRPEILYTDQSSQFTSEDLTSMLSRDHNTRTV